MDGPSKWFSNLLQGLLPERRTRQSESTQQPEVEVPGPDTPPIPPEPFEPSSQAVPLPTVEASEQAQPEERVQLPALPGYAPPAPSQGNRRRLFIAIAILIPLLTSAVVGAAFLREGSINQEEGLQLVELADSKLLEVQQALEVEDRATARASLSEAQRYLDEAIVLIGVTDQIQELSEVIATELQDLLQVRALYSLDVPLLAYAADAEPQRIVVSNQDIYVLDSASQAISPLPDQF